MSYYGDYYYGDYGNRRRRRSNTHRGWDKGNWEQPWEQPVWPDAWKQPWEDDDPVVLPENIKASIVPGENQEPLKNVFHRDNVKYLIYVVRERAAVYAQTEAEKRFVAKVLEGFEQKAVYSSSGSHSCYYSYISSYAITVTEEPETGRCTLELLIDSKKYSETFLVYVRKPDTEAPAANTGTGAEAGNTTAQPETQAPATENSEAPAEVTAQPAESTVSESTPAQTIDPKAIIWTIGPKDRWNSTGYTFQRNDGSYLDMTQVYEFIQRESETNPHLAADFPFIVVPAGQPANNAPSFAIESKGRTASYRYVFSPDYKKRWGLEKPAGDTFAGAPANLPAIVVAAEGIRLHTTP
ncbi:MAG: hypothetical protein ACRC3B_20420, partial [Bacteroidia bacterium]